jgi:hypothetical protein
MLPLPRKGRMIFTMSLAILTLLATFPVQLNAQTDPAARRRTGASPSRTIRIPLNNLKPVSNAPDACANVIVDGGFENGGIPSSTWDPETSTNFGTPLCDNASCGTGGGASPPRTGLIWAWFGGIPAPETATLGQTVNIASSSTATLNFWMRIGTVSSPFTDVLNVRVDGTIVQSFPEPATPEAAYTLRTINLNAFANGANHQILFEYIGPSSGTGSYVIDDVSLDVCSIAAAPTAKPFDFTGDGRADLSVFNPSTNAWTIQNVANLGSAPTVTNLGAPGDKPVPADYDGDLKYDIAVFTPTNGNWIIRNSSGIADTFVNWGANGDRPVPGDYNGDGKADQAVFRPSEGNWYVKLSGGGSSVVGWGNAADVVVPGDYDGDKRNDYAIYRPSEGNWYIRTNPASGSPTVTLRNWGVGASDIPIPADYDGDGKTDIAIYRTGEKNFYIINSATNTVTVRSWGASGDVLVPADYDETAATGKADIAVYRQAAGGNQWFIIKSSDGTIMNNGTPGVPPTTGTGSEVPVPSAYISTPTIP